MGLLEAIAIPLGSKVLSALIKGDLEGISSQVLEVFFGLILEDLDVQQQTLDRIEWKLDQVLDQDYARDFETARLAISDSFRASTLEEYNSCLSEAWSRLRSAAAGTQDLLRKADAHYLAAITALLRSRPADALDRSRQARDVCVNVAIEHLHMFQYCGGDGNHNRAYRAQYPSPRLRAAEMCVYACTRADELSVLLAYLGEAGHPVYFDPLPVNEWAGVKLPATRKYKPWTMFNLTGGPEMQIPGGPVMRFAADCGIAEGTFPLRNFSGPGPTPGVFLSSLLARNLPIQGRQHPGSLLRLEAKPVFSIASRARRTGAESIQVHNALPALPVAIETSDVVEVHFQSHLSSSTITPWIAFMVLG